MKNWLALPGVPAGSTVFKKLPVQRYSFTGLETPEKRSSWTLDSFVDELFEEYCEETILLGQDFGGLIAAMATVKKPPKALVLTGTAVHEWWRLTRWTALPILHHFFYGSFQGRLFYALGQGTEAQNVIPLEPKLRAKRMRTLAKNMKPPPNLLTELKDKCPIFLIWGTQDLAYPLPIAQYMANKLHAPLFLVHGGHYCMWNQSEDFLRHMMNITHILQQKKMF